MTDGAESLLLVYPPRWLTTLCHEGVEMVYEEDGGWKGVGSAGHARPLNQ